MQIRCEFCTFGIGNAVFRPRTALLNKRAMVRWVPVTGCKHRQLTLDKLINIAIQGGYNLISIRYSQTAAGQKIILDVDD